MKQKVKKNKNKDKTNEIHKIFYNIRKISTNYWPTGTQYSGNISWVFHQLWNVWDIQRTISKHYKGKYIWWKFLDGKVAFVLKVCDLILTNVDLYANSSNQEVIFPKYLRNIPRMSVSRINVPRILPEYCKVMKTFLEVKNFKKLFCGISCENVNLGSLLSCNVFLNFMETVLHLE